MTNAEIKEIINNKWEDEGTCMKVVSIKQSKDKIEIKESYLENIITIHIVEDEDDSMIYWTEETEGDEFERGHILIGEGKYKDYRTLDEALKAILLRIGYSTAMRY